MEQNPDLPDLSGLSEEEKIKLLSVIKKAKVRCCFGTYLPKHRQVMITFCLNFGNCLQMLSNVRHRAEHVC